MIVLLISILSLGWADDPQALPVISETFDLVPLGLSTDVRSLSLGRDGSILAMDSDGKIHLMRRDGRWTVPLSSANESLQINDEDILLDVESSLEERIDTEEPNQFDEDDEVIQQLEEDLQDQIEGGIFDPLLEMEAGLQSNIGIWYYQPGFVHFACRKSGCYRSFDGGKRWNKINTPPNVHDMLFVDSNSKTKVLLATEQGIWYSQNFGDSWRLVSKSLSSIAFYAFATDSGKVYAGSDRGLYVSKDGNRWDALKSLAIEDVPIIDVIVDRNQPAQIIAASKADFYLSNDNAQTFVSTFQKPIRKILKTDIRGHFILIGSQGLWKSIDEGVSWNPLFVDENRQLFDVIEWKGTLVFATSDGVYYLAAASDETGIFDPSRSVDGVASVVRFALLELENQTKELQVRRDIIRQFFLPTLSLYGSYDRNRNVSTDYGAIATIGNAENDFQFGVELCIGACSMASTASSTPLIDEVMVMNGEVYATNTANIVPAAAGISTRLSKYKRDKATYAIDLFTTHQRLSRQQKRINTLSLLEQVQHALEIQEVVSRLDALTDGRYRPNQNMEMK